MSSNELKTIRRRRNTKFVKRVKLKYGCSTCGYNKHHASLHFDHLDRTKKYKNVSILVGKAYSLKTLKEEMRKCQILCANCHSEKTFDNQDYLSKP